MFFLFQYLHITTQINSEIVKTVVAGLKKQLEQTAQNYKHYTSIIIYRGFACIMFDRKMF